MPPRKPPRRSGGRAHHGTAFAPGAGQGTQSGLSRQAPPQFGQPGTLQSGLGSSTTASSQQERKS